MLNQTDIVIVATCICTWQSMLQQKIKFLNIDAKLKLTYCVVHIILFCANSYFASLNPIFQWWPLYIINSDR